MDEQMLAQIMAFGGTFTPEYWARCNGQLLTVMENQALFALLGATYGGDGRTTFALPDLCGRSPIGDGKGQGLTFREIGERGGYEQVLLTSDEQLPSHSHALSNAPISGKITCTAYAENAPANQTDAAGNLPANQADRTSPVKIYADSTDNLAPMNSLSVTATHKLIVGGYTNAVGDSAPHENMSPWTCLNFIIALKGYFPSRSRS